MNGKQQTVIHNRLNHTLGLPNSFANQLDVGEVRSAILKELKTLVEVVIRETGIPLDANAIVDRIINNKTSSIGLKIATRSVLWSGLENSDRLRWIGAAGLDNKLDGSGKPKPALDPNGQPYDGYAHLGIELWTKYASIDNEGSVEHSSSARSLSFLQNYALISATCDRTRKES